MDAIEVRGLTKDFGNTRALRGATFTVNEHEIFGLIGPNGAGKTTTLRILSTLISASGGEARVFGFDVARQPEQVREILSSLPEDAGAYQMLTGQEFLAFLAGFYS